MKHFSSFVVFLYCAILMISCAEETQEQETQPQELTRAAIGYFCGMIIADHSGPKGQILVESESEPLWFSSVRDTLAYTRLPEETSKIRAIYVSDMSRAESWNEPGEVWIEAADAFYVVGSTRMGGMGAAEVVPFATDSDANAFAEEFGGEVYRFDDIPDDVLLGDALGATPKMSDHRDTE